MTTVRTLLAWPLAITLLSATTFAQPSHLVNPSELVSAIAEHAERQDQARATIRETLDRPEVREVAARTGFDLDRLHAIVGTMDAADLEQASTAALQVNDTLVGGQSSITISTTTIIIGLLVLILLIVAID